jgi:peptidoglycan/xylan/chitin deacetylase (PgdA/CDA1 family)
MPILARALKKSIIAMLSSPRFASTHGVISIAFDDGLQNVYDYAFPLMKSRGIVGTFYVITDHISDFSHDDSSMSIAKLQTLQDNGNEIGSHSKSHVNFLGLSDAQINEECSVSKHVLQSNGFAANNFAYPYGDTNNHVNSIVSQYYRSARSGYIKPYIMPLHTHQFELTAFAGETGKPSALLRIQRMVDEVASKHCWTIVFFHSIIPNKSINPYSTSSQDFSSFLDYVVSKGVKTLTVNQALDLATRLELCLVPKLS